MGAGEGPFVAGGAAPPPPAAARLTPGTWSAVAVLGAVVFVLGIWTPVWHGVRYGYPVSLLVAGLGGVLFIVGLTYAWQGYQRTRPRSALEMPGVELFHPPTAAPRGESPDEESR